MKSTPTPRVLLGTSVQPVVEVARSSQLISVKGKPKVGRPFRHKLIVAGTVAAVAALGLAGCSASAVSKGSTAKPISFTMATSPWIGYGPWYIAQQEGYFKGLNVKLENFDDYSAELAAISSDKVDGVSFPVNATLQNYKNLPVKATLLLDSSVKADAILAGPSITSFNQLKGKRVAYELGTTSQLLLSAALKSHGMTFADIKSVPTPSDQSGGILAAGNVDAAVTYEPYITAGLKGGGGVHLLVTASKYPLLISDALYLENGYLTAHPKASALLAEAWGKALAFYDAHPKEGQAIIAKGIGAEASSLTTAFAGVKFYTVAESATQLPGTFQTKTLPLIQDSMLSAGMIKKKIDLTNAVDATGAKTAAGK